MRVAVLRGGISSERDTSLESGDSISRGLAAAGHEVVDVEIAQDGAWSSPSGPIELVPSGGLLDCEVAFPALHGPGGEDGVVQGLLEVLGIPYVGSGVAASALCMDKILFKGFARSLGLPQVDYVSVSDDGWREAAAGFGFPVWVKPARLGSSIGISRVESDEQLDAALELACGHDHRVIIEASAPGKEVECSLLGHGEVRASTPGELVVNADWYDFEAKYTEGGMDLQVPAGISPVAIDRVKAIAIETFRAFDCSGLGRCDFFVDGDSVLLSEMNTIPGFTQTSVYARLWEEDGISYPDLCDRLLACALERDAEMRSQRF